MTELKPCPFCGVQINSVGPGELVGWHKVDCFFNLLDEHEVNMTYDELNAAFIDAWNRRAVDDEQT